MKHNSDDDYVWDLRHEALYHVQFSALYHQKRERFFELLDKLGKAASLFGGSGALWKSTDSDVVSQIALVITATSALSLVFSFSERSKRHAELATSFRLVAAEIMGKGERGYDEKDVNRWNEKIYKLEAKEPPSLSALAVLCQNELAIAQNQPDRIIPQTFWVRWLAPFFDLPQSSINAVDQAKME